VLKFTREQGYCPSFAEIAEGVGLASSATVHKHIETLVKKGWLKRGINQSRSLEAGAKYIKEQRDLKHGMGAATSADLALPLVGRIAAGRPIEAPEQPESISLADIAGRKDVFVLQVSGESMIDDHIMNGEIAVALVGGSENTLKRLYHERDGRIRLQPANAAMAPIMVAANEVAVQGRVVGVLRRY
jgi:repressor LexA